MSGKTLEELLPDLQYSVHVGETNFFVVQEQTDLTTINIVGDLLTRVIPKYAESAGEFEPLMIFFTPVDCEEKEPDFLTDLIPSQTFFDMSKESQLRYLRDMIHALRDMEHSITDSQDKLNPDSLSMQESSTTH